MPSCAAYKCSNNGNSGFKFFRFPADPVRRRQWAINSGRVFNPTVQMRLCEAHFEESQFETHRADGKRKLKPNAVPTLFDLPAEKSSNRQLLQSIPANIPNATALTSSQLNTVVDAETVQDVVRDYYHCCIVPYCNNTRESVPGKLFVDVPKNYKRRKLWFESMGRNISEVPLNFDVFCCEDHFNLAEDVENWDRFRLMGEPLKLKNSAVPRVFTSQNSRTSYPPTLELNDLQFIENIPMPFSALLPFDNDIDDLEFAGNSKFLGSSVKDEITTEEQDIFSSLNEDDEQWNCW
ncbi:uncharacterized protein [Anabrus simplex]|uniref:uncharacterized protein isoform X2 n=1 Tax=Anabrus simplex TaxID=316456 RepID=UPI0035A361D1